MVASIETARLVNSLGSGRLFATLVGTGEAAADTPPVVSNVSPVTGSTVARMDPLSLRVTDAEALKGVTIFAEFSDRSEVAYDGRLVDDVWVGAFQPGYESSTIDEATGGFDFIFTRARGWYGDFDLTVRAHDGNGNE